MRAIGFAVSVQHSAVRAVAEMQQGPWTDGKCGEAVKLKPEYRLALALDGYVLVTDIDWGWTPEANWVGPEMPRFRGNGLTR